MLTRVAHGPRQYRSVFQMLSFSCMKPILNETDPPYSLLLWESEAEIFVSGRSANHVSNQAWKMTALDFDHSEYGGITDIMKMANGKESKI